MHVHWLYMSPGLISAPLILSFPLSGAGAHGNRRKQPQGLAGPLATALLPAGKEGPAWALWLLFL